jgi:hypothetical protein
MKLGGKKKMTKCNDNQALTPSPTYDHKHTRCKLESK